MKDTYHPFVMAMKLPPINASLVTTDFLRQEVAILDLLLGNTIRYIPSLDAYVSRSK